MEKDLETALVLKNKSSELASEEGQGKCNSCSCTAYVSDSAHDGHCICGHTAADHAF